MKTYYDEHVLIKTKEGNFKETRVSNYLRYIHTIKPLEELLKWLED